MTWPNRTLGDPTFMGLTLSLESRFFRFSSPYRTYVRSSTPGRVEELRRRRPILSVTRVQVQFRTPNDGSATDSRQESSLTASVICALA